jgi:hypothetical protein
MGNPIAVLKEKEKTMPLVRIDLRKGKDAAYRQEIGRVVYEALKTGLSVMAKPSTRSKAESFLCTKPLLQRLSTWGAPRFTKPNKIRTTKAMKSNSSEIHLIASAA